MERYAFLKWGQSAFDSFKVVPPGMGIVHQVNLEKLARVIFGTEKNGELQAYPDTVVGTDSHTTMINGIGVLGWGVGGIEAESVMLGQCTSMVLPEVIGFKMTGELPPTATATDLVLLCTQMLRKKGVVDKFVEFYGPGVKTLTLADRATISNMAPEYGATIGLFPMDQCTLDYLKQTGRSDERVQAIGQYLKTVGLFKEYDKDVDLAFSSILELDLSTVQPCVSGPKRPQDYVSLKNLKQDWNSSLTNAVGFKGYGLDETKINDTVKFGFKG